MMMINGDSLLNDWKSLLINTFGFKIAFPIPQAIFYIYGKILTYNK